MHNIFWSTGHSCFFFPKFLSVHFIQRHGLYAIFWCISMQFDYTNLPRGLLFLFDSLARILKLAPACACVVFTIHMCKFIDAVSLH